VVSTASDSASITSIVKMAAFQFYLQSGKLGIVAGAKSGKPFCFSSEIPW
jgi:hypothetical protein